MRRKLILVIALPLSLAVAAIFVSASNKTPVCKGKTGQCCLKKQSKPANHEMILENLHKQFIMIF